MLDETPVCLVCGNLLRTWNGHAMPCAACPDYDDPEV